MADEKKFEVLRTIPITVERGYNHIGQLAFFEECHRCDFSRWYESMTDKCYPEPTNRLVGGKEYLVEVCMIKESVEPIACLDYLKKNGALLVGAQGLTYFFGAVKGDIPLGWLLSFDDFDRLWQDYTSNRIIPGIFQKHSGGRHLYGVTSQSTLYKGDHFLSFKQAA